MRSPSTPPRPSGLPSRRIRKPHHYRDDLPPNPNPPILAIDPEQNDIDKLQNSSPRPSQTLITSEPTLFCTQTNSFSVYRKYSLGPPTITPDEAFILSSVSDSTTSTIAHDP